MIIDNFTAVEKRKNSGKKEYEIFSVPHPEVKAILNERAKRNADQKFIAVTEFDNYFLGMVSNSFTQGLNSEAIKEYLTLMKEHALILMREKNIVFD